MNITINTQAKTVTIETASLKEVGKIKKALEAIGENPDAYTVLTGAYPYYVYPTLPQITWLDPSFVTQPNPDIYHTTCQSN